MVRTQGASLVSAKTEVSRQTLMPLKTLVSPLTGEMPIYCGDGAIELLPGFLKTLKADKIFVISDHRIFDIHGATILQLLHGRFAPEVICIAEGENEKKLSNLELLCKELFDRGATKSSVVVNFGGGVILNIGGLAASLIYRGIRFLHIPTTLMAQSDVIVSNKQGINFEGGKNRLGLYATPLAAFADPRFVSTEMPRQLRAALVEYCKNALILGGNHFSAAQLFFADGSNVLGPEKLRELLTRSLEQKFEIAKLDPTEKSFGLVLEYGHTVGHAIEGLSQGRLLHGEAVYHGLNVAGRLANALGIFSSDEYKQQAMLLCQIRGIPNIPTDISVGQILQSVHRDNKKKDENLSFVLLRAIGKPHWNENSILSPVPEEVLRHVLLEYRDALL